MAANASLFIIMAVAGKVGLVAGPLPYDETECKSRVAELNAEIDTRKIGTRYANLPMEYRCVWREKSPDLDEKVDP